MELYLLPSVEYYDYQKDVIKDAINSATKSKIPSYGLFLDCGLGKAQPLSSKIKTPNSWTTIGEIKVGDLVDNTIGGVAKVVGIYPQGVKDIYKITLTNGASTKCCKDHLWRVSKDWQDDFDEIVTLEHLSNNMSNYCVPVFDYNQYTGRYWDYFEIESIELVGKEEAQCIMIDSENHLYITDDYIITHNTVVSMTIAINYYKLGFIDKVEVIFPASLKGNWNQEINKFVPVEYRGIFNVSFSHQGVSRGNIPELNKRTLLVIDESHNFSSGDSSRTKLMVKISNKFAGILSLSGTPKTNSAIQLLYQSNYLGFKISKKEFVDKYCYTKVINIPYFRNGKRFILTKQAYSADMKSESEFLSWFTTRSKFMRTEDAVDLPEKVYVKRYYELTKEQKKILERIKEKLESIEPTDDNVKASLHTLTQVYSGIFLNEEIESPKLELLVGLLEELGGKQLIIFTNYKSELSMVCKKLNELKISHVSMSGDDSSDSKEKSKELFISGKVRVLVGNIVVLREGHNFVNANHICYFSNGFNLSDRFQSEKRIHRIGQTGTVFYHDLISCSEGYDFDSLVLTSVTKKELSLKKLFEKAKNGK